MPFPFLPPPSAADQKKKSDKKNGNETAGCFIQHRRWYHMNKSHFMILE